MLIRKINQTAGSTHSRVALYWLLRKVGIIKISCLEQLFLYKEFLLLMLCALRIKRTLDHNSTRWEHCNAMEDTLHLLVHCDAHALDVKEILLMMQNRSIISSLQHWSPDQTTTKGNLEGITTSVFHTSHYELKTTCMLSTQLLFSWSQQSSSLLNS